MGPVYEFRSSNFYLYSRREDSGDMGSYHCHNFYELYYLESGQREYLIEKNTYTVNPGYFVLIKPHVMHQTFGGAFTRRLVHFGLDFLKPYISGVMLSDILSVFDISVIIPDSEHSETVAKYWDIIESAQAMGNEVGSAMALASLLSFLNMYKNQPLPTQNDSLIDKITDYIEKNALGVNSLDEIAKEFHISKYYLCHLFQSEKEVSAYDFLSTLKIAHASYALAVTNKKIKEIAYECGFQSEYYFSKRFKQLTAMSPREYRKLLTNKEVQGIE